MNPRLVCYGRRMTLSHDHYRTRCCDLYGGIIALNDWSGMIYERITIQDTRMRLPFAPHLADAQGAIHRGLVVILIDAAAGQVAMAQMEWRAQVATISIQHCFVASVPKGAGLVAEGKVIAGDDEVVLVHIRVRADDNSDLVICEATVRLIAIRKVEPLAQSPDYPLVNRPGADVFFGAGNTSVTRDDGVLTMRFPFRDYYMGNRTRNALHGGVLAAALAEAADILGGDNRVPFQLLDGQVDYLRSATDRDMIVTARMDNAGSRVGFCSLTVAQDVPGQGRVEVARMSATLGRHPTT